jgi:hypothetical protein
MPVVPENAYSLKLLAFFAEAINLELPVILAAEEDPEARKRLKQMERDQILTDSSHLVSAPVHSCQLGAGPACVTCRKTRWLENAMRV